MNKAASHLVIGLIAFACQVAVAQSTDPLKDAVQRAITTNPEVVYLKAKKCQVKWVTNV